ncbi:hypothetical protein cypCar_00006773, partial [Cyprinus carpio]
DPTANMKLNSYVVSASVTNATVSNLEIPVMVTLRHLQNKEDVRPHTTCSCDHLTHFGVLLDISKTPISAKDERILTIISYLGCGISSIFLGLFIDSFASCWLKNDVTFYVTVVSFVTLVMVCNICVFAVVLVQIHKMWANKPSSSQKGFLHDLRVVASLTFLLGLTWILSFGAWGPAKTPLLYLFSLLNSLQGNSKGCCLWPERES